MWEYPENLRYKLHLRAAQCFWKLRKRKSMEESLMRVQDIVNNCEEIPEIKKSINFHYFIQTGNDFLEN